MEHHMYLLFNWAKHIPCSEENIWFVTAKTMNLNFIFSILFWKQITGYLNETVFKASISSDQNRECVQIIKKILWLK